MAGRLSSGALAAGLIGLRKPSGGGGGGSAYDVVPPVDTSEAVAAGSALSAKTFGSFTGDDAAAIDAYTLRTVNASGSTSWAGQGLGPYTPTSADGDAGVIALDAKIGGVVVATALHDYARAAPVNVSPDTLVDISGVSSYDFLTTGGTGGSGGQGSHTVGGISWDLDYLGTSGPTRLEIVSGVLYFEGTPSARAMLNAYMAAGGLQTGYFPLYAVVSVDTTVSPPMAWGIAQNLTNFNGGNESQYLLGYNGSGVESATSLYVRENTTGTNYNTVKAWDNVLTDVTTTPTRMSCRMMGGSWAASYDQGTSALPTDLANLTHFSARQNNDFNNAATPQNRNYLYLNLFNDCAVRCVVYKGSVS